ncbi:site-specific recombinase [uncultured Sphaerotilus sp.]|uniref:site-specific recombinase n=1 Tax=uncultured Sphaerotilus sp. TaxID=474984 RepID=UPI0030CA2A3E
MPCAPPIPRPLARLGHLLDLLDADPLLAQRCRVLLRSVFATADAGTLLADFGFSPRSGFGAELIDRLRLLTLPGTPDTGDLGQLFQMVFHDPDDADWLAAIDVPTLARIERLLVDDHVRGHWHRALIDSVQMLASQVRAVGLSASIRPRIDPTLLADRPFHQLAQAAALLSDASETVDTAAPHEQQQQINYLRVLLDACRTAAASVREHLDAWGVSVDVVFQIEQLHERIARIEALLNCLAAAEPAREWQLLTVAFARSVQTRRSVGALFSHHYAMLARKVAERSAATGEHYITRTRDEYFDMLRRACGGGLVIAGTTFLKFAIGALTLSAFWAGFWTGTNYAASFVLIHLLHWTVATKQPAMTAPAMAAKLEGVVDSDAATEDFVDEVTHLIRTQIAGILGNVLVVAPVVLLMQLAAWQLQDAPLIDAQTAHHVLDKLTLLGPTLLYAAFTGVLLFLSSLIAGWWENWFVFHRLDSAIAHNPRIVRWLGSERAQRWSRWWRENISGLAANCSLGMMLGLVPTLAAFFGLPIEVRHVTLSAGQIAAALGTLGVPVLHDPAFWWCVAAIPLTGALNVLVSFTLAFRLALRSRGLKVRDRGRLYAALRQRVRSAPGSFLRPA